jgi:hypothetical protein
VQWEKGIGPVGAGIRYSLTLRVRADGTRPFGFGLSEADDPWTPLELYYYETATRAWREFYFEVVPDRDYPRVRILVDAGASDIPLEIGLALVQPVSDRITDAEKARLHRYMDAIGTGFPSPSHPGPSR